MANIKSAKKRILVERRNAERNKAIRSRVKTAVKRVNAAIAANDKDAAGKALVTAVKEIDKAAGKGVFHRKNSFKKSFPLNNSSK